MFSQVLVFALLFLSKRAAGLTALSGLAFTCHPPAEGKHIEVELGIFVLGSVAYADVAQNIMSIFGMSCEV